MLQYVIVVSEGRYYYQLGPFDEAVAERVAEWIHTLDLPTHVYLAATSGTQVQGSITTYGGGPA